MLERADTQEAIGLNQSGLRSTRPVFYECRTTIAGFLPDLSQDTRRQPMGPASLRLATLRVAGKRQQAGHPTPFASAVPASELAKPLYCAAFPHSFHPPLTLLQTVSACEIRFPIY